MIYNTVGISYSNVKVRWQEPYVSSALNSKTFGVIPKGIYEGFCIGPGGLSNRDILISSTSVSGLGISGGLGTGLQGSYVSGGFDDAFGFSIAVHQNTSGWQTTVNMPPGSMPVHLDATGLNSVKVFAVIDVNYNLNQSTTANFLLVDSAQIDANPSYIVIGYCNIPISGTGLNSSMFGYNDPNYPRLSPMSTSQKSGLMPASAWPLFTPDPGITAVNFIGSPYSITSANKYGVLLVNSSTGAVTLNLPSPALNNNLKFTVKDVGGQCLTNPITFHRFAAENFENVASDYIAYANYGVLNIDCDGVNWWILTG